ncbi:2'-5' RNA ligase family protein [Labilibaculum euxinus]
MIFPYKFNIHFALTGKLKEEIIALNKELVKNNHSAINFAANAMMIPHITLIMGEIKSETEYKQIIELLSKANFSSFSFKLSRSVFASEDRDYLFMYPDRIEKFLCLKKEVFQIIKGEIKPSKYGGVENKPHLTLAYFENYYENFPINQEPISMGVVNNISIGQVGKHGTCLNSKIIRNVPYTRS